MVLDVAIGLIFIYLLFSLICSALSEIIAWFTDLRARTLRKGIETLLADESLRALLAQQGGFTAAAEPRSKLSSLWRWLRGQQPPEGIASKLYDHALIKAMRDRQRLPSYISDETFVAAFLDLLRKVPRADGAQVAGGGPLLDLAELRRRLAGLPDGQIKESLQAVLDETVTDITQAKARVERWFNATMDRVAGWYKRRSQWVVFITATVLVVAANADSVSIARLLARDAVLREALVSAAKETTRAGLAEPREQPDAAAALAQLRGIEARMQELRIPLGWEQEFPRQEKRPWMEAVGAFLLLLLVKLPGLGFTILAVSLGAPFWFDMLNKVVNVRISGRQPHPAPAAATGTAAAPPAKE
jgi:hypothetical protein